MKSLRQYIAEAENKTTSEITVEGNILEMEYKKIIQKPNECTMAIRTDIGTNDVICYGLLADTCNKYLKTGDTVVVSGNFIDEKKQIIKANKVNFIKRAIGKMERSDQ